MAIIVEDGTNVPNANSYVTIGEFSTFASERGLTLPATDPEKEVLLIKAMDFLETMESRYLGYRTFTDQYLVWPRTNNNVDQGVPANLKKAQMVLAHAAQTVELFPISSGTQKSATRKTVGPITVEYYNSHISNRPDIPQVKALLAGLLLYGGGSLPVVRA